MDVGLALSHIDKKKKHSQKVSKIFVIITIMCTLIYFSLATIFDKTADALLAFHQEKQSITFRVYSEYFLDYKQTAQRISDIAYIESSGISTRKIHYKNQLTKD